MRIAVVNITAGGMSEGYKKYLCNTLPHISDHSEVDAILCLGPSSLNMSDWFEKKPNLYFGNCSSFRILRPSVNVDLRRHLDDFSPDIIFVPTERFLKFGAVPVINMVQNMECIAIPFGGNLVHVGVKNILRQITARIACRNASHVIAVSQYVKDFLASRWKLNNDKVSVIHHGTNDHATIDAAVKPLTLRTQDVGDFFFTAGSLAFYRGIEDIIKTMELLKDSHPTLKLLVAGEPLRGTYGYSHKMKKLAAASGVSSQIVWMGQLNQEEMSWCFYHCKAFVMTSRIEACPNLVLEAFSHGCLNISTKNPPMPELFGDGALYYRAGYPNELANQLIEILSMKPDEIKQAQEASLARANQFSWSTTAEKLIQVLQKVIVDHRKTSNPKRK